ncbi:hypothetical protein EYD10_00084 [Varanus komodoensis]|nr:hypothetical protein EYD10_00084 [Varanus komodoensis]
MAFICIYDIINIVTECNANTRRRKPAQPTGVQDDTKESLKTEIFKNKICFTNGSLYFKRKSHSPVYYESITCMWRCLLGLNKGLCRCEQLFGEGRTGSKQPSSTVPFHSTSLCLTVDRTPLLLQLNSQWVIPELVGHTMVTVLMLISLHWFIFLLNLPVATWNIYRYIMVPSGNMGVFDPTEIHNRGQLKSHMKEAMIKLGFHLLCFFMYLYSMILALIND